MNEPRPGASRARRIAALTAMACATTLAHAAHGQPTSASATPEEKARVLFDEAKGLRAEGKWRDACVKFKEAHEAFATGGTTFALADCADREGDLPSARSLYQRVLDDPDNKDNPDRIKIATNRIAEIDKKLATTKAPDTPSTKAPPQPPSQAAPRKRNFVPGGVVLGVGGAVLVAGGVLGGVALSKASNVKAACNGNVCPPGEEAPAKSAKRLAAGADACFGIGAAAAVAGVIMMATMTQPAKGSAIVEPTTSGFLVRF